MMNKIINQIIITINSSCCCGCPMGTVRSKRCVHSEFILIVLSPRAWSHYYCRRKNMEVREGIVSTRHIIAIRMKAIAEAYYAYLLRRSRYSTSSIHDNTQLFGFSDNLMIS